MQQAHCPVLASQIRLLLLNYHFFVLFELQHRCQAHLRQQGAHKPHSSPSCRLHPGVMHSCCSFVFTTGFLLELFGGLGLQETSTNAHMRHTTRVFFPSPLVSVLIGKCDEQARTTTNVTTNKRCENIRKIATRAHLSISVLSIFLLQRC